jgi:hypothetical protein
VTFPMFKRTLNYTDIHRRVPLTDGRAKKI